MFALLLAAYLSTQALDTGWTLHLLASNPYAVEANPVLHWAADRPAVFITVKGGMTIGSVWAVHRLRRTHPRQAMIALVGLTALHGAVVWHNLRQPGSRRTTGDP